MCFIILRNKIEREMEMNQLKIKRSKLKGRDFETLGRK